MKQITLFTMFLCFAHCSSYDVLIKNGQVYDGTGGDSQVVDLGIRDGKIVRIEKDIAGRADKVIDATGQIVSPGFIDVHAHLEPLSLYPDAKSHIMQGVTTALGGPDGGSPFPIGSYLDTLVQTGVGLNVGYLIGHNTVRNHVMGLVNREPNPDELTEMMRLVENAMKDGAFGISTGLKYLPGTFAKTDEIIALAKVAAQYHGIYTSHLREEGLGLLESVTEAIEIGRETQMTIVLTHHKAIGQPMWGASKKTLTMVDEARSEGLDIRMDQYPYTASHTGISVVIPPWSMEGGRYDKFRERAVDPRLRDSIRRGIIYNLINDRGGNDLRRIQFARINWKEEFAGKTLHDLVIAEGMEPTIKNGAEMIIQIQEHGGASAIYHVIDPEDVKRIMEHPMTMVASDGRLTQYGNGHPHPRAYGTFPRVLGRYVREQHVLTLSEAIRKMTSLPAETLGLIDRGKIAPDYFADLVIFDKDEILDRATFQEPHQYPAGIEYVILNGKIVVEGDTFFDLRVGKALHKNSEDQP